MDINFLKNAIKEKFEEEIPSGEYYKQLNKIVELEDKLTQNFTKEMRKEYLDLDILKGGLNIILQEQLIEFIIKIFQSK